MHFWIGIVIAIIAYKKAISACAMGSGPVTTLSRREKIKTYLFFNDEGVLGTSQGYTVSNAFFNLRGMPYDLQNSQKIFYRILMSTEEG